MNTNKGLTVHNLTVGQAYEEKMTVTQQMVERFAAATGDYNPIHTDDDYARKSIFKQRVAHGMLQAGILSGIVGTKFPGVGTIYLSQTLKFTRPVFIGDQVAWRLTVRDIIADKNRVLLDTICTNQKGETVVTGEALVMPPS